MINNNNVTLLLTTLDKVDINIINHQRDEYCCWAHPVYVDYLEQVHYGQEYLSTSEWEDLQKALCVDLKVIQLEDDVDDDIFCKYMDNADISEWCPTIPEGYFIVDIGMNEEGAYCLIGEKHLK